MIEWNILIGRLRMLHMKIFILMKRIDDGINIEFPFLFNSNVSILFDQVVQYNITSNFVTDPMIVVLIMQCY